MDTSIHDDADGSRRAVSASNADLLLPIRLHVHAVLNPVCISLYRRTDPIPLPGDVRKLGDVVDVYRPVYGHDPVFGPAPLSGSAGDIVIKAEWVDYDQTEPVERGLDLELYLVRGDGVVWRLGRPQIAAHAATMMSTVLPDGLQAGKGIAADCCRVMWAFRSNHSYGMR